MPMKKVAIYTRVSTSMQVDKDSLPTQRSELIYYAKYMLGIDDYEVFEDAGFSAKDTQRPEFQRMFERIRAGEFSHLLVWKIDRFSRSLIDFCALYQELKELGVVFISKNERFDTSTAIGEAVLRIILVFAELERKLTSERVAAVAAHRSAEGKFNGGTLPLGYRYNKETKTIETDPVNAEKAKLIFDNFIKTQSFSDTCKFIGDLYAGTPNAHFFTVTTICDIIRNPYYIGIKRYYVGGERYLAPSTDGHEIFISDETWRKANDIADSRTVSRRPKHDLPDAMLKNVVYCGACNQHMTRYPIFKNGKPYIYFTCNNRQCKMHNRTIPENRLVPLVLQVLLNLIFAQETLKASTPLQTFAKRVVSGPLMQNYTLSQSSAKRVYTLLREGKISEAYYEPQAAKDYSKQMAKLENKIARDEDKLRALLSAYDLSTDESRDNYRRAASIIEASLSKYNADLQALQQAQDQSSKYAFTVEKLYSMRTSLHALNIKDYFKPSDVADFLSATVEKIYATPDQLFAILLKNTLLIEFSKTL